MPTIKTVRTLLARFIDLKDVDIILADCLQKNTAFLVTHSSDSLAFTTLLQAFYRAWQRKRGYSTASIIGKKEFFGFDFIVSKHTLIPRPDTELIVEHALQNIDATTTLIDIGTGSGCIPITIAKKTTTPLTAIYATDISKKALKIAKKNNALHTTSVQFFHGNLLEPIVQNKCILTSPLLITANLPYLRHDQFTAEKSIQREPINALVAENNGLALYQELLEQLRLHIPKTTKAQVLFEIDPSQTTAITNCIQQAFPQTTLQIHKDLAKLDRVIQFTIN